MLLGWPHLHGGITVLYCQYKLCICVTQWTVRLSRAGALSPSLCVSSSQGTAGAHVHVYSSYCWFIIAGAVVLLRLLAFPVRSGRCRNPGQKAIQCASQSGSPVGSLVWMWCEDHAAQRPGLCSQAQKWLLSHARPAIDCILVQEWRRPSSNVQSLLYISVAVFNTWP